MKSGIKILSVFLVLAMILIFLPLTGADDFLQQPLSPPTFSSPDPSVSAQPSQDVFSPKIVAELRKRMAQTDGEDLIPVYPWLKDINEDVINRTLLEETGFDQAVYQDSNRFETEIVPQIEAKLEAELGYEAAHRIDPEWGMSPISTAINDNVDEYIIARRKIVKRLYSAANNKFIADNIGDKPRKIIYNSEYTSTLTVEATKAEIIAYSEMDTVEEISLYVEYADQPGSFSE